MESGAAKAETSVENRSCSKTTEDKTLNIVEFLADPAVQSQFGLKKTIALSTTQAQMYNLGYCWGKLPNGQYIDGHERDDVVAYQQTVYLPA